MTEEAVSALDIDVSNDVKSSANEDTCGKSVPTVVSHWTCKTYANPWESGKPPGIMKAIKWKLTETDQSNVPWGKDDLSKELPVNKCGDIAEKYNNLPEDKLSFTWIGHATFLLRIDGKNILADPVFSDTCAPAQVQLFKVGARRYREIPCEIKDLPKIDAVIISHNHYDHLDSPSVYQLLGQEYGHEITWYVPMGSKSWFIGCGIAEGNIKEMTWWDEEETSVNGIKFVFTPAQHWCCRNYVQDKNKSLWGSWVIIGKKSNSRFYFAGDTGYNDVAFKQIGYHYGPFDLAAIPIGAYKPRWVMEFQHVDPKQAVKIHQDIKSFQSIGVHWGTFALAYEHYLEPRSEIKKAIATAVKEAKEGDISAQSEDQFITLQHGETRSFDSHKKDDSLYKKQ